ncbi:DUF2188 domain-containing protein [Cupriavidus sp. L7L]|uniref:DUF2188 domain-containing protein n=1 Tax=Cupriavidus sp. L7L TaxID=2546443 RepID=UPI0010545970|nr:DUF2188 domain-containing protein [Cupriavidus sp. L7L]TDF54502.1 DUF2188 domain-containing protein [Cupriavidus sp. L7L]
MPGKNVHVVPAEDGWAVEFGCKADRTLHATQDAAIAAGTERAKRDKVELLIHGRDAQIRERNSFGHDPRNVKG